MVVGAARLSDDEGDLPARRSGGRDDWVANLRGFARVGGLALGPAPG